MCVVAVSAALVYSVCSPAQHTDIKALTREFCASVFLHPAKTTKKLGK